MVQGVKRNRAGIHIQKIREPAFAENSLGDYCVPDERQPQVARDTHTAEKIETACKG